MWLGSVVFFSFVVAPSAFHALGRDGAAPFLQVVFPRYYLCGILAGVTMLGCALMRGLGLRATAPIVVALVLAAYARQVVTPAVARARSGNDDVRFQRLHRLSVRLNVVVLTLLLLLGAIVADVVAV